MYFISIDGRRFECGDIAEALNLLKFAQDLATRYAELKLSQNVTLTVPKITVSSRKLRRQASQTMTNIKDIYVNAEIKQLMTIDIVKQDNIDSLLLLI
jgi:hypothetical protein